MKRDPDFWSRIATSQDELLARVSSVETEVMRLPETAPERRAARRFALPLFLTAAVMTAASAIFVLRARSLTLEVGDVHAPVALGAEISAPTASALSRNISDGSTMRLGAAGRARLTHLGSHGAAMLVERGHADISVVPRLGGSWGVDVGPFHVAVKGTRFSLDWDPAAERLDFVLERGAVVITGACLDGPRPLIAGQSLHASCRWQPADLPPKAAAPVGPAGPDVQATAPDIEAAALREPATPRATASTRASVGASASVRDPSNWRQLASSQQYRNALAAAERGGFEAECRRAAAEDLLVLGDVARLAGSPARAVQAYTAARAKHLAEDRSAFALGLVEFDQRRDFTRAAAWFETYLREQPGGTLAEQAEGRLMDAWQRAGDFARAKDAARAYLARTPDGAYADLARQTLR